MGPVSAGTGTRHPAQLHFVFAEGASHPSAIELSGNGMKLKGSGGAVLAAGLGLFAVGIKFIGNLFKEKYDGLRGVISFSSKLIAGVSAAPPSL